MKLYEAVGVRWFLLIPVLLALVFLAQPAEGAVGDECDCPYGILSESCSATAVHPGCDDTGRVERCGTGNGWACDCEEVDCTQADHNACTVGFGEGICFACGVCTPSAPFPCTQGGGQCRCATGVLCPGNPDKCVQNLDDCDSCTPGSNTCWTDFYNGGVTADCCNPGFSAIVAPNPGGQGQPTTYTCSCVELTLTECADGTDNDGDGDTDLADGGCSGPADDDESNCGDGVRETGEACDGSDLNGQTCVSQGFSGGTLSCKSDCSFDTSGCSSGAGVMYVLDANWDAVVGGSFASNVCGDYANVCQDGLDPSVNCHAVGVNDCMKLSGIDRGGGGSPTGAVVGFRMGNLLTGAVTSNVVAAYGPPACGSAQWGWSYTSGVGSICCGYDGTSYRFFSAGSPECDLPYCGDNSKNQASEECDGTDLDGENCISLGNVCGGGSQACTGGDLACSSCSFVTSGCSYCGDNSCDNFNGGTETQANCFDDCCTDGDNDGYATEGGSCGAIDCDDADAAVNPGGTEICGDGKDNDCSSGDEACPGCTVDADCGARVACERSGTCVGGVCEYNDGFWNCWDGTLDPGDNAANRCEFTDRRECGSSTGECTIGEETRTCDRPTGTFGAWGGCSGQGPVAEDCTNGLDDDCDGTPDNCGATCDDGVQNGLETGVDCGGPDCPACAACAGVTACTNGDGCCPGSCDSSNDNDCVPECTTAGDCTDPPGMCNYATCTSGVCGTGTASCSGCSPWVCNPEYSQSLRRSCSVCNNGPGCGSSPQSSSCSAGRYCTGGSCVSCDGDGDGHAFEAPPTVTCGKVQDDCDDGRSDIYPGAEVAYCSDGIENDCSGDAGYGEVDYDGVSGSTHGDIQCPVEVTAANAPAVVDTVAACGQEVRVSCTVNPLHAGVRSIGAEFVPSGGGSVQPVSFLGWDYGGAGANVYTFGFSVNDLPDGVYTARCFVDDTKSYYVGSGEAFAPTTTTVDCWSTVQGYVTDPENGPLQGASVEIPSLSRLDTSDLNGFYQFVDVLIDDYTFTARGLEGYYDAERRDFPVRDDVETLNFVLDPWQCDANCTFGDDRCDYSCVGESGCSLGLVDPADQAAFMGVCDNALLGSQREFNVSHVANCCIGPLESSENFETPLTVQSCAEQLVPHTRLVNYNGKIHRLTVVTYRKCE